MEDRSVLQAKLQELEKFLNKTREQLALSHGTMHTQLKQLAQELDAEIEELRAKIEKL